MRGKPVKIFRHEPARDYVDGLLRELGLLGFHDLRWFSLDELSLKTLDDWLPELESYYLPCKAKRFLHEWTPSSILTVLRHILQCHAYHLVKEERLYKGLKQTLYQLQPLNSLSDLSGASLQVDFN
jgi:hypothetical protein